MLNLCSNAPFSAFHTILQPNFGALLILRCYIDTFRSCLDKNLVYNGKYMLFCTSYLNFLSLVNPVTGYPTLVAGDVEIDHDFSLVF